MRKNFTVISVMTMVLLNASQANANGTCVAKQGGWGTCSSSVFATTGSVSCGTGCTYTYNNGTITITADKNSENPEIDSKFFSPFYRENNQFTDENGNTLEVNNVLIDGVIKLNADSFASQTYVEFSAHPSAGTTFTISGKDGTLILDNVGYHAIRGSKLAGNIIWRGNNRDGFHEVTIDGNLIIEDTATVSGSEGNSFSLGPNGKVFCNTDMAKCQALLTAAGANSDILAALQAFPEGCSSLNVSGKCAKCKNNNFNLNDGECDRIRWTPAEAAKVLHDDNTNVVTITFKHQ